MLHNQAVNVMGFAYHYFTTKPGLFEARVFVLRGSCFAGVYRKAEQCGSLLPEGGFQTEQKFE